MVGVRRGLVAGFSRRLDSVVWMVEFLGSESVAVGLKAQKRELRSRTQYMATIIWFFLCRFLC